jgi:hypothetical protein
MWQNTRTVDREVSQEDHASKSYEFKHQGPEHVIMDLVLDR